MRERFGEGKARLGLAAAFLAGSLALLVWGVGRLPGPAARIALAYMGAATRYDYGGMYQTVDPGVLEWELELSGMDQAAMEEAARLNGEILEGVAKGLGETYGVTLSYAYQLAGERELEAEELEELAALYAADGYQPELLEGREVSVRTSARLAGERRETLERELEITVLRTPLGWGVEGQSVHAFETFFAEVVNFAWQKFGL